MITVSQTEVTLPDIKLGESHTFYVIVTNSYPFSVHVGVGVGCGSCTIAGLYPNEMIEPNGNRTLQAKFTPTSTGAAAKRIFLNYCPQGETTAHKDTITFKANVLP